MNDVVILAIPLDPNVAGQATKKNQILIIYSLTRQLLILHLTLVNFDVYIHDCTCTCSVKHI